MEKLRHQYDREYMKLAMLKHEETFREQVYELHRLYRIQKMLMKEMAGNQRTINPHYRTRPEARKCLDVERPAESYRESGGKCRLISEMEDDQQSDLELTLGPRTYYHKKIKAAEPAALQSESGPSFSSSSTESRNNHEFLKWGPERPVVSNQERLNSSPPWLFQALSLNMT